jgi:peptidoglycan/LPS O-acetylase OafA/YrhL
MDITLVTFVILALAAFRLTHLVTTDAIADGFRTKVWKKFPPSTKIGYLITCNWCTGFWVSGFLVIFYLVLPVAALVVSLILAISASIGLISAWIER